MRRRIIDAAFMAATAARRHHNFYPRLLIQIIDCEGNPLFEGFRPRLLSVSGFSRVQPISHVSASPLNFSLRVETRSTFKDSKRKSRLLIINLCEIVE